MEQYEWRVDGRLVWEYYHEAVEEELIGCEEVRVIDEEGRILIRFVGSGKKGHSSCRERKRKEKNDREVRGMVVRQGRKTV